MMKLTNIYCPITFYGFVLSMYSCLNAVQFFRYTGTHLSVLRRNCCIFIVLYIFSLLSILQNLCYVEMISQWQAYEQGNATGTFLVYFTDYILYNRVICPCRLLTQSWHLGVISINLRKYITCYVSEDSPEISPRGSDWLLTY